MFIALNHQQLNVYSSSRIFIIECYKFSKHLPPEEKFSMVAQIRRAALSVHLNIAEGSSRNSRVERKRYYEIARGSLIEIDAAFDIAYELNYFSGYEKDILGVSMKNCFSLLTGLINSHSK